MTDVPASTLQEAIDTLVASFDYPAELTVDYQSMGDERGSTIQVTDGGTVRTFTLRHAGRDQEPELEIDTVQD